MAPTPIELPLPPAMGACAEQRFASLRGVLWRINLGILPASPAASIEDLRRVAADTRRSYASLRRSLLIDPHLQKDGSRSPGPINDNPLSQNPDSLWGCFFRNAELEKMVDQDLSRLYPEHGSYFQSPACQAMLRRILLLWCLRHPEYGYKQGMHELLAPLLYVLQVDLQQLSQVQGQYEDLFNDEFDETSLMKIEDIDANDDNGLQERSTKISSLDELDPDTRDVFLLIYAYGAEGELGVILSERFLEHDAYSMFDSLMSGSHGVVAMADFFSPSVATGSSTGVLPVIEASSALYHLLSIVDSALHTHLVEFGVEPQYFALRWLRVLFGREFSLDILLLIWDEIFSSPNSSCIGDNSEYSFRILCSPRGAFIAAMAVSMLLHVRSSLFATENATSCLQRLLNFPAKIDVKKLVLKAKSLQALALDANIPSSLPQVIPNKNKPELSRVYSLSSSSTPPKTPDFAVPDCYWEEKWRVLHEEEALKKGSRSEKIKAGTIKGSLVERFGLSRTESEPSPAKILGGKKDARTSVRHRLLDDFSQEVVPGANLIKTECNDVSRLSSTKVTLPVEVNVEKMIHDEPVDPNITGRISDFTAEGTCLSAENSSVFSLATSHHSMVDDEENNSEKSSMTSNSSIADNDEEVNQAQESCSKKSENPLPQDSEASSTGKVGSNIGGDFKHEASLKDRKPLSGKFQLFRKLGKGSGEGSREKGGNTEVQKASVIQNICHEVDGSAAVSSANEDGGRSDGGDKKLMGTFKNLGQSMLENLQVIESAFQQDRGQSGNIRGGNEQVEVMAALEELRKISNVLSEM